MSVELTQAASREATRVLLIDSQPLSAAGLACLLGQQPGFSARACSPDADLQRCIDTFRPSVVVISLHQDAVAQGLALCRSVSAAGGGPLLLLARRQLAESGCFVLDAIEAGADGILVSEQVDLGGLLAALRDLAAGRGLLDPRRLRTALAHRRQGPGAPAAPARIEALVATTPVETLTAREREVARLLAAGFSTGAIAEQLFISVRTVQCHINSILSKLGAHTRVEAMAQLYQQHEVHAEQDWG